MQQNSAQFFIQRLWRHFCRGALAVIILVFGVYGLQLIYLAHIKTQVHDLSSSMLHQKTTVMQFATLQTKMDAHAANKKILQVLSRIPQLISEDMYLEQVEWAQSVAVLKGYAKNEKAITDFINTLISNSGFKEVVKLENNKANVSNAVYFQIHVSDE